MKTALILIHNGQQEEEKEILTLTVEIIEGVINIDDLIFLKQDFFRVFSYPIKEVKKIPTNNLYELKIGFPEMEWMWKDRILKHIEEEDKTAFCGMSLEQYQTTNFESKIRYYSSIVELLGKGRVIDFINSNIKLAKKILPDEPENISSLSKFGGVPLAPSDFSYPNANGHSTIFIGQIDLKEFNQFTQTTKELEAEGVLYFFGSIQNNEEFYSFKDIIIKYSKEKVGLTKISLPLDLEEFGVLKEQNFRIIEEINIPPQETSLWIGDEMDDIERNSYWYLEAILQQYNNQNSTKLLGYPCQIQGCVLLETELKNSKKGWYSEDYISNDEATLFKIIEETIPLCKDWRLLMEFDGATFSELSNFSGNFNEYMDGKFYVMIRQDDLDNLNFDHIETVYQCT